MTKDEYNAWIKTRSKAIQGLNLSDDAKPWKYVAPEEVTTKPETTMSKLEDRFSFVWKALGGVKLDAEVKFHPVRKWRFDFALVDQKIAIELEGGIWTNGAHSRGAHFNSDAEKYNQANLLGWRVFRLTTDMISATHIMPIIEFTKNKP